MDALLLALLACLLVEMGDRCQLLTLALSVRYRNRAALIAGIILAAFANATLSAIAGGLLSKTIGPDARTLLLGLAFLFGGVGLLMPVKRPDLLTGWRIGPLLTSGLGLFILAFGNSAQFLTAAIAARTADPVLTAIGAGMGMSLACIPVILLKSQFFIGLPLRWIRRIGGILLLIAGAAMGLGALGLL
ncbi:MAG: TMEM165/GDT1 family protein [Sphingobium phenoxybenzoativorans]|uniref:TMEM165/GDT1 family protein n=1 Tax=Sphingobium phenoxybenzoativorans TaxID=1592790 RepID=UPI000871E7AF|nr:TMEM165/GDT1 family protein [Sphingobium phenoxybenzoativorans]